MNIYRTTCAHRMLIFRKLFKQIEKVVQAASVVVYKDAQPLALKLRGPSGPPIRR